MKIGSYINPEKNISAEQYDFVFILLVILLLGLGFTVLYSGSLSYGTRFFDDPLYFVKRQLVNFIIGLCAMIFCSLIDGAFLKKILPSVVLGSFILMVLPFVPGLRSVKNGSARWVKFGKIVFQPSEFIKITIVLFLSNFFAKNRDKLDDPFVGVFPPFFISEVLIMLTYFEPDFSTSMFLTFLTCLMFFIAGVRLSWFVKGIICFIPLAAIMILSKAYRLERVLGFLFPENDPLRINYQVNASIKAICSGGLWGAGLGNGVQKISSVPEVYSDFMFVVWAEEMGFVGVVLYFLLICAFAFLGFRIAFKADELFFRYLAFGSVSSIVFQSLLNASVVSRLLPATGVPMPFFSYGGSALISTMCFCGFIINASKNRAEVYNV